MATVLAPSKIFKWNKVLENESETTFSLKLEANNPYFEGHFPGNPVFPGVAVVDATLVAMEQLGHPDLLVSSAKFLGVISPGDEIKLVLKPNVTGKWVADWYVTTLGGPTEKRAELIVQ